jgi:hypothetical protein
MVCPDKQRAYALRRLYGLSTEQYDELLERQSGNCAVCLRPESEFNVRLAVDHDHISGEVRGLLCRYCNHRLVGRHRDPELLRRIADYLEVGTGWFVPPKKKKRKRGKSKSKTTRSKRTPA